jgi:type IV pilus assembly protein PilX
MKHAHLSHTHLSIGTPASGRQRGAALIISLLILILLTILGLSSMQTTNMEERMASNARDREIAFQAAEAALAVGERWVMEQYDNPAPTGSTSPSWRVWLLTESTNACNTGLCGPKASGGSFNPYAANAWDSATALDDDAHELKVGSGANEVTLPPEYVVQLVSGDTATDNYIFRIYAKGWGGGGQSEVVLQSTFKVEPTSP